MSLSEEVKTDVTTTTLLTGFVSGAGTVTPTDSILPHKAISSTDNWVQKWVKVSTKCEFGVENEAQSPSGKPTCCGKCWHKMSVCPGCFKHRTYCDLNTFDCDECDSRLQLASQSKSTRICSFSAAAHLAHQCKNEAKFPTSNPHVCELHWREHLANAFWRTEYNVCYNCAVIVHLTEIATSENPSNIILCKKCCQQEENVVVHESKKIKTETVTPDKDQEEEGDDDDADECSDICEPDDEDEDGAFVVHYTHHIEQGSSFSRLVGIFRKHKDAVSATLPYFDNFLDSLQDEDGDVHFDDPVLQLFADEKTLTSKQQLYVCKKLCQLQKSQRGEFLGQATGIYVSIERFTIQ